MKTPKLYENMYIMFDENNKPEYGFTFIGSNLQKFIPLTDKKITSITLPMIVNDNECPENIVNGFGNDDIDSLNKKRAMQDYIYGYASISPRCFEGVKDAQIIIPFKNSLKLNWECFDHDANIELLVPESMSLKQIYRKLNGDFDSHYSTWTIVADKNICGEFGIDQYNEDSYSIRDYDEKIIKNKCANIKIISLTQNPSPNSEIQQGMLV